MQIEVLVGMISSGKSTYARKRADEGAMIICHDDLTQMAHGGVYRYEQELRQAYRRAEEGIARAFLGAGRDVVIDRTHMTRESRTRWTIFARQHDAMKNFDGGGPATTVVAVVFFAEAPEVHARRRYEHDPRGRPYLEWLDVARRHHEEYVNEPVRHDAEGFDKLILMPIW